MKIFVILSGILLSVCLLRLIQMQLLSSSFYREKIAELKLQRGYSRQLKTVRGKILDRKGRVLAADEPRFCLQINYRLSSFADDRVKLAKVLKASRRHNADLALAAVEKEHLAGFEDLQQIIDKCVYFGVSRDDIENRIKTINDKIWNLRTFLAWRRNGISPNILKKYDNLISSIPMSEAIADFEQKFPDVQQRLILTAEVDDIADMDKSWPLLELKTDDDIFTAQLEFLGIDSIEISPKGYRFYPYRSVAAQTIGWVGPEQNKKLFSDDKLLSYLEGEVSGNRPGAEYVCEAILRGRRGEIVYNIDRELVNNTQSQFGKDVTLSLDIEFQERIEKYLANSELNNNYKAPTAVVVIEVATGDILALVSTPVFDLNLVRENYTAFAGDPDEPLRNRSLNKQYPPGSVVKPVILIAGLEAGRITSGQIINCLAHDAPEGWPSCWIYNKFGNGHDDHWSNIARNAIKGSCNIYFSRLAELIDPLILQQYLFKFGYGQRLLLPPAEVRGTEYERNFMQVQGQISSTPPSDTEQLPPLQENERRWFGIGQGNMRVSPLQVANAMATIARGGLHKRPRLFIEKDDDPGFESISLNLSPETLGVVRDGICAVVNETGGSAYDTFAHSNFGEQGVKVYGKTGSTEKPYNAWFAGFAEDRSGRSIAIAVMVEGGQTGSSDAAPLARDIIQFCIEAGYIGQSKMGQELSIMQ